MGKQSRRGPEVKQQRHCTCKHAVRRFKFATFFVMKAHEEGRDAEVPEILEEQT